MAGGEQRTNIAETAIEYFGDEAVRWAHTLGPLARTLREGGATPAEYFAYLTREYADTGRYANVRNSPKIIGRFLESRPVMARVAELNAYLDRDTFDTHVNIGEAPRDILLDPRVELSPLFKYVMSVTLGFYDIAPRFQEDAVTQLRENMEYFKAFDKYRRVLPIKEEALRE